jgi:hypothetical protein
VPISRTPALSKPCNQSNAQGGIIATSVEKEPIPIDAKALKEIHASTHAPVY